MGTYLRLWEFPPGSYREWTDEEGRFVLGGLPAGTYYLAAYHDEYARAKLAPFKLAASETIEGVVLQLSEGATIAGMVTDEDGSPFESARVVFKKTDVEGDPFAEEEDLEELADEYDRTTRDDGTYVSPLLPDGVYRVTARARDRSCAHEPTIRVTSGMTVEDVDFELTTPPES